MDQLSCHRIKECCVKLHNCVQNWEDVNSKGFIAASKLVNAILRLRFCSFKQTTTLSPSLEVSVINEREDQYEELKSTFSQLADILKQMGTLASNLTATAELIMTKGCDTILFETLQASYFGTYPGEIFRAYSEELSLKESILSDILTQNNQDTLTVYLSCWLHQPFLDPGLVTKLEALLSESGLRK